MTKTKKKDGANGLQGGMYASLSKSPEPPQHPHGARKCHTSCSRARTPQSKGRPSLATLVGHRSRSRRSQKLVRLRRRAQQVRSGVCAYIDCVSKSRVSAILVGSVAWAMILMGSVLGNTAAGGFETSAAREQLDLVVS